MGVSSSQPIPSSQHNESYPRSVPLSATPKRKRAKVYTPTMDDEAASQQLMSEARGPHSIDYDATPIPLALDSTSTPEAGKKKTRKSRKARKLEVSDTPKSLGEKRLAGSQTSSILPPTYSLEDLQAFVGESPSKSQTLPSTEPLSQTLVPCSQVVNGTVPLTPAASAQATSPVAAKRKRTKSKRKRQADPEPQDGDTIEKPHETLAEGASSQKRRKKHQSQDSVHSVNADATEAGATPAATQEVQYSPVDHMKQGGALPDPLTPKALLESLHAERSQRSRRSPSIGKPPTSAQRHQGTTAIMPEDADAGEHPISAEAEHPDNTSAQTAGSRSVSKKKRTKKIKPISEASKLDWDAPVRSLDDTPIQPFAFDEAEPIESPPKERKRRRKSAKTTDSARSSRHSVGGLPRTPSRKPARNDPNKDYSRARDDDDRTAADRALEGTTDLGHPAELRTSGDYSADENELLRRAIRDFQQREGLDTADLVSIIQFIPTEGGFTAQAEGENRKQSATFWEEVKAAGLRRNMKYIKEHVRATYHTFQRGPWSEDEDEQLRGLVELYPNQWKLIATTLHRLRRDVFNRWNDYVQHGEGRVTKRWSVEEEATFVKVLSTVCQRAEDYRADTGQPPLDDYLSVVNWSEVCKEMGNTRSRLQCQYKLKQMTARVPPPTFDIEIKPRTTPPPGGVDTELQSSRKARRTRKQKSATADDMLWGDKLSVLQGVLQQVVRGDVVTEDQIDWHSEDLEIPRRIWSVPILKKVYKELCELCEPGPYDAEVEEDFKLLLHLRQVFEFLKDKYGDELEEPQFYDPGSQVNGEDGPHANSSKKRRRQSGAGLGKKQAKKQDFKSKELVTESDNAESEAEV